MLDKMLFVQLEAVVQNAIDTLSCHSRLVFNIMTYIVYITSLQSGEAWPPFLKKWGDFGPPGPTYCYAYGWVNEMEKAKCDILVSFPISSHVVHTPVRCIHENF